LAASKRAVRRARTKPDQSSRGQRGAR
jgi:hypothetical protein